MTVYLIAFILPILGIIFNNRLTPWARRLYVGMIFTYLIIILGMRYRVGVDTITYMNTFQHLPTLDRFSGLDFTRFRYEPGYLFLSSLVRTFTDQFWVMQTVVAIIVNGCIFIFLRRYCRNIFVGIIIFFILQWFYFSMEIMRESIALSIFLLNYKNIQEKRWGRYYLYTLLSVAFHYSAAITWFIPFARILKPNIYYLGFCIGAIVVAPIMESLNEMLSFLSFASRIDAYVEGADKLNIFWKLQTLVQTGFPAFAALVAYKIVKKKFPMQEMLLLQILLCMAAFAIPIIFSRFTNYTSMFVTVALANILCDEEFKRNYKIILVSSIILSQSFYYYSMYPRWVPYISILDPRQINEREQIWKHDFITW